MQRLPTRWIYGHLPKVDSSHAFREEVEQPVSDSTGASLDHWELLRDAQKQALPPLLQPSEETWAAPPRDFKEMEGVRWRSAVPVKFDVFMQCIVHNMRTLARRDITTRVDIAELSRTKGANVLPSVFLKLRHSENLEATALKQINATGEQFRRDAELLKQFPGSTHRKVEEKNR